jgi:WD40 repeat protein
MKVICNMTLKKRYQNYNLDGHKDQITCMDCANGILVSGSKDCAVKIWDIEKKKGSTFLGKHSNQINQVLLWDENSAFSSSVDKTIRYFDVRDWGASNENFTRDSESLNGYQFSKYFMGHKRSITKLMRLNNSHNRIVSTSEDASIKIWDLYANQYCEGYSNSAVKGNKFDANTEIISPLVSLEGEGEH